MHIDVRIHVCASIWCVRSHVDVCSDRYKKRAANIGVAKRKKEKLAAQIAEKKEISDLKKQVRV